MAKLSENQKLGVIAGVAVAIAGLGGGGVWWAKGLAEEKQLTIEGMRSQIQDAESKIRQIPRAETDVIVLRENLYEYVKILPEQTELNNFVRITNQFKTQSGVNLVQFIPGRDGRAGSNSPFERYTYRFELTATLWQFLQFMSFFENYERFVQVKEFALSAGNGRQRDATTQDVIHKISMKVETYAYNGGDKTKDVSIPSYAAKVEKLREEIFEARQTISSHGYKFQGARGRRDIFMDPREAAGARPGDNVGPSPRDQRKIIDRMRLELAECQEIYQRLQDKNITVFDRYSLERSLREKLVEIENKVDEMNTRSAISHAPLKLSWTREVMEPLAALRRQATIVEGTDKWLPGSEMKALLERMKDDLTSGDIASAVERYDMMEDRLQVPSNDERHALYRAIEGLYLRAKLAEEFSALRLEISGICVNDDGRSGVVLNGVVYEEGEYIDNNLLVKGVERDSVEFVYKGFTVVKTL